MYSRYVQTVFWLNFWIYMCVLCVLTAWIVLWSIALPCFENGSCVFTECQCHCRSDIVIVYSIYTSLCTSALDVFSFNKRLVLPQAPAILLWPFCLTKYKAMGPDGNFGVFSSLQCMGVIKSALTAACIHVRLISENTMLNQDILLSAFQP